MPLLQDYRVVSVLLFSFCAVSLRAATPGVPKWEVTGGLSAPKAAYFDLGSQRIYISNIAGEPGVTDGNGWISKVDEAGKVLQEKWVTGVSAPKGMSSRDGQLWVSDLQFLLKIDVKTGTIAQRSMLPGTYLSGVAAGPEGEVYVSDLNGSQIYKVAGFVPEVFIQGLELETPNALLVKDGKLWVAARGNNFDPQATAAKGHVYSVDLVTKERVVVAPEFSGNFDGIEMDSTGALLVSDSAAGTIHRIPAGGKAELLLSEVKGAGFIGWIPENQTLIVPRLGDDKVSAYRLSKDNT